MLKFTTKLLLPLKSSQLKKLRLKNFQISRLSLFKMFGCARDHDKKFPKFSQTSFSGIVYSTKASLSYLPKLLLFLCVNVFRPFLLHDPSFVWVRHAMTAISLDAAIRLKYSHMVTISCCFICYILFCSEKRFIQNMPLTFVKNIITIYRNYNYSQININTIHTDTKGQLESNCSYLWRNWIKNAWTHQIVFINWWRFLTKIVNGK